VSPPTTTCHSQQCSLHPGVAYVGAGLAEQMVEVVEEEVWVDVLGVSTEV